MNTNVAKKLNDLLCLAQPVSIDDRSHSGYLRLQGPNAYKLRDVIFSLIERQISAARRLMIQEAATVQAIAPTGAGLLYKSDRSATSRDIEFADEPCDRQLALRAYVLAKPAIEAVLSAHNCGTLEAYRAYATLCAQGAAAEIPDAQ